ncbi:MAG TPA: STAS domain-containing protein [Acidimicrobiales bacterium]|nr:STAS domain-containing protein [Acidimicrobiales bacterium]
MSATAVRTITRAPEGWRAVAAGPRVSREAGCVVVWLEGEQDAASRPALCEVLVEVLATDDADLVVDLGDVTFIDASTVGALLRGRSLLIDHGRWLTLRRPSAPVARVLELCGLQDLVGQGG